MLLDFGISREQFTKEYREKSFRIHKNALGQIEFGWEQLNAIIYCTELRSSFLQLYKGGLVDEEMFMESYSEIGFSRKRIIKNSFYEYLRNGATLILNRVETKSPLIKNICVEIARFAGAQTLANGYLAFGGEGSFGNHWDTHDVFAVQLIGRKRWKIYKPTFDLPIQSQTSKFRKHECPSEPVFDDVLESGDVLYVPRGWWHNAQPSCGETFHIAVGVHPPHVVDYFSWICANILPRFMECRDSVLPEASSYEKVMAALEVVHEALADRANFALFSQYVLDQERLAMPFSLEKARALTTLDETTVVGVRSAYGAQAKLEALCSANASQDDRQFCTDQIFAGDVATVGALVRSTGLPLQEMLSTLNDWMLRDLLEVRD